MDDELPDLKNFCASLAQLHRDSVSPEGKFGFHTQTYNGNIPQDVRWTDTWEECFVNGTKMDFELEREACGATENMDALIRPLFEKVIRSTEITTALGNRWSGTKALFRAWGSLVRKRLVYHITLLMRCLIDGCLAKPRTTQLLGNQWCLMPQASTATMNVSKKQTEGHSCSYVIDIRLRIAGKSTSRQCR
jgi:hypothetical protein